MFKGLSIIILVFLFSNLGLAERRLILPQDILDSNPSWDQKIKELDQVPQNSWKKLQVQGSEVLVYEPKVIRQMTLVLHGCSQNALDLKQLGNLDLAAEKYQSLMVVPQVPNGGVVIGCWNYYGDQHSENQIPHSFLINLVQKIKADYNLKLVNVMGFSSGGGEANILACLRPDIFSGLGLIASPHLGSDKGDLQHPSKTPEEIVKLCRSLDKYPNSEKHLRILIASSPQDFIVAMDHSQVSFQAFGIQYSLNHETHIDLANITQGASQGSFVLKESDSSQDLVGLMLIESLGHNYPAGKSGDSGRFVKKGTLDFAEEFLKFINVTIN